MTNQRVLGELDFLSDIEKMIDGDTTTRQAFIEALVRYQPCDWKNLALQALLTEGSALRDSFAGIYNTVSKPVNTLPAERFYLNPLETPPDRSTSLWSGYVDASQRTLLRDEVKRIAPIDDVLIKPDSLFTWPAKASMLPPSRSLPTDTSKILMQGPGALRGLPSWYTDWHDMSLFQLPNQGNGSKTLIEFETRKRLSDVLAPFALTDHPEMSSSTFEVKLTDKVDVHFGINLTVQAFHPKWALDHFGDPYVERPKIYTGNTWRKTLPANVNSSSEMVVYALFHDGVATQDFVSNVHLTSDFVNLYKVCEHRFTNQELNTGVPVKLSGGFSLRRVIDRFALNLGDPASLYKPKYITFLVGVSSMDNYIDYGAVHFQPVKQVSTQASGSIHASKLDEGNTLDVAVIAITP